ncbi:MAG TPA: energy transducer TonB [Allosphingosinicella sp.]|jgi:protein TonB
MRNWKNIATAVLLAAFAGPAAGAAKRGSGNFDYPAAALREGRQGTSYFHVTIDVNGRARDCVITRSSGHKDLDAQTCKMVVERGMWTPATNFAGEAIETSFEGKIDWKIGG